MDYNNPLATNLIKKFEGYSEKPYWDHKQWSTGFGTRWTPGTPIGSRADHEAALAREAAAVDDWIAQNVKQPLAPHQRAALTSFGYNVGTGRKGASRLLDDINAGNWDRVGQRMLSFNKASGKVNEGLVNRRRQEVETLLGRAPPPNAQPSTYQAQSAVARATGGNDMAAPIGGAPIAGGPMPLVPPTGRKSKLGEALLAAAATAKPKGWGELLNSAGDLALGYSLTDKHDKETADYRGKLAQALSGASGTDGLATTLIGSGDEDLMKQGVTLKVASQKAAAEANAPLKGKERFMVLPDGRVFDVQSMAPVDGIGPKEVPDDTITLNGRVLRRGENGKYEEVYVAPPVPPKLEATDRKEIFEADEGAQAAGNVISSLDKAMQLNDKAYSGPMAETRGYLTSLVGADGGVATQELQNVVTQQVLNNLKATFGAAPTEGERQILERVQGSVNQAPEVRKRIFEEAKAAAEKRMGFNTERSRALRSGEYFQPGYSPSAPAQAAPEASAAPQAAPAAPAGGPARISTPQEYQALPPGTQYIAPDGSIRTKQ